MVSFHFDDKGIGDRLDQAGVRARISINQGLREIGGLLVPILKRHTPTGATKRLRNTTRFQIVGNTQVLQIRQGAKSDTGFFYGQVVRGGRRPGAKMPPSTALIPWVQKKLGVPSSRVRSVAFLVARKIGKKGIKPNPYHERALREARTPIQKIVTGMGRRITAYLAGR